MLSRETLGRCPFIKEPGNIPVWPQHPRSHLRLHPAASGPRAGRRFLPRSPSTWDGAPDTGGWHLYMAPRICHISQAQVAMDQNNTGSWESQHPARGPFEEFRCQRAYAFGKNLSNTKLGSKVGF